MRKRCPVDEIGLPLIPEGFDECYEDCDLQETNRHHLLYPRAEYRGYPERHARESGQMVVKACVCKHKAYHAEYLPPKKPSRQTLVDVAQGDLSPSVAEVHIRRKDG